MCPNCRLYISFIFTSHCFFFFNDTATTEIYTLSLHDALPIFLAIIQTFFLISWFSLLLLQLLRHLFYRHLKLQDRKSGSAGMPRPISYAVFCLKKKKLTSNTIYSIQNNRQHTPNVSALIMKSH